MVNSSFRFTISDVHDATGIPRNGSGQRLIRDPLRKGTFGSGYKKVGRIYFLNEATFKKAVAQLKLARAGEPRAPRQSPCSDDEIRVLQKQRTGRPLVAILRDLAAR
jgi:hypothetical protein